jgi:hypothetical protein
LPDWGSALLSGQRAVDVGATTTTSLGTTITNSGVANTESAWVQLSASMPFSASFMLVMGSSTVATSVLGDIGVGASGSEYIVSPNLYFSGGTANVTTSYSIPCSIDAGQRVAARMQSTSTTGNLIIVLILIGP